MISLFLFQFFSWGKNSLSLYKRKFSLVYIFLSFGKIRNRPKKNYFNNTSGLLSLFHSWKTVPKSIFLIPKFQYRKIDITKTQTYLNFLTLFKRQLSSRFVIVEIRFFVKLFHLICSYDRSSFTVLFFKRPTF